MKLEQVVDWDERGGEDVAVTGQERFEIFVGHVGLVEIFKLDNVEVLLRVEEFVGIVGQNRPIFVSICVPLGEMMM